MVLARLEKADLAPSSVTDRYTLARRLYFDLIGLPPTIDQIRTFIADKDPQAYTRLVNQLLDSEQFGERWARHWLDVARFGDTKGYVFTADRNYPNAYKYRDWVINAINDDMPYDRFLKLQLAADLIIPKDERTSLAALGFLTLGRRFINNKHDIIDDRIDVVFRGTMGLTVGCARCHDHKYDPLSTADYYAMYGIFQSSREQQDDDLPLRLVDRNRPANSPVFLRGNPLNHGDVVPRRYLSFFAGKQAKPFSQGSGRLELAEAIVDRNNPLTARVFVNRVWGHLFGAGLVRTPSDFGLRSEPPTHQDVLDHLAGSFMQDGWSVKRLPSSGDHEQRIRNLYETVFARLPDADELAFGRRFVTATEPPAAVVPAGPWQFGYGNVDGEDTDGNQQVAVAFELLPYFTGDAWRGGPNLPDPDLGWAAVSRTGGHPGNDQQHASIRRWVAPRDGVIQIRGKLKHPADQGDGVRGRIVSSRTGVLAAWNVTHQEISTVVSKLDIRAGDTVDFIVDCRTDPSHDSFDWPVSIRLLKPAKVTASRRWDSRRGFHGPGPAGLTVWQRYAQTLMLTNEFIMLD